MLDDQIKNEVTRLGNLAEDAAPERTKRKISGLIENYKEPLSKRIVRALFEGDPKSVALSLINEVAIPKTKDILADFFTRGIEKAIYGDDDTRGGNRGYYSGYSSSYSSSQPTRRSSYDSYYRGERYYTPEPVGQRPKVRWDRIVMRTRPQAIDLVNQLRDDIKRYKAVSVSDLYDYITDADEELGAMIDSEFPDNNWGWVNLDRVPIESVSGGYWVKLPKPVRIN